jgi:Transposase and inactivated derivatives
MDSFLGIASLPFKISPCALLRIAFWAQNQGSYQRAEDTIREVMRLSISDDTIRAVTNFVGNFVFSQDCMRAESAFSLLSSGKLPFSKKRKGVVFIQTDGAALNTRVQNEEGSTWRENKLGEVFSSPHIRFWTDKNGKRQHQILKKEYVSYVGSVTEFKKHLLACAVRGGYGEFEETVVISDGATWIRNMVSEIFPDAQHILDYFHLCENVNTFAKYLFPSSDVKAKSWSNNICEQLKKGNYVDVLEKLEPFKSPADNRCPVNLYGYISNNIHNIDYPSYIQKGYFIGSGAIESGNKIVLQDRLKRAGMRWNPLTAQSILSLKAKVESDLWYSDVELPFLQYCFDMARSIPQAFHQ